MPMKTITIELSDEDFARVRGAFLKLRAWRLSQGTAARAKYAGDPDKAKARAWFLAAALVDGAESMADAGPG